jgi:uncharacterized Zn-finger protein
MILAYTLVSSDIGVAMEKGPSRFGDDSWFFEQIRLHGRVLQGVARAYAGTPDIISAHQAAIEKQRETAEAVFQEVICMSRLTSPDAEEPEEPEEADRDDVSSSSVGADFWDVMSRTGRPDFPESTQTYWGEIESKVLEPKRGSIPDQTPDGNSSHNNSRKSRRSEGSLTEKRHRRNPRRHQCPKCEKNFTRHWNMRTHLLTHEVDRERPFQCEVCLQNFYRIHDLDRHKAHHNKVKSQHCPCGKSFSRKDALRRHITNKHGTPAESTDEQIDVTTVPA